MLEFLADECVGDPTIKFLRSLGFSVVTVWDLGLRASPNATLLKKAIREHKVFLTADLDFSNILVYPPSGHCGIILLKISRQVEDEVHSNFKKLLEELKASDFDKTLLIVDRNKYRIRREVE